MPGLLPRSLALLAASLLALAPAFAAPASPPDAAASSDGGASADVSDEDPGEPDAECLAFLDAQKIKYRRAAATRGVRTPIELAGPLASLQLTPMARRAALMDCQLARALLEAEDVFKELQITELLFSAAYHYRTRRDSPKLSGHAHGLAIDVHRFNHLQVEQDFEMGVGVWRSAVHGGMTLEACIGAPTTDASRALRTLACRLKLHPAFRVIVTRDDNEDHSNHFHLEAYPDLPSRSGHKPASRTPPASDSTTAPSDDTSTTSAHVSKKRRAKKKVHKKTKKKKRTTRKRRGRR